MVDGQDRRPRHGPVHGAMRPPARTQVLAVIVLAAALGAAACGSSTPSKSSAVPSTTTATGGTAVSTTHPSSSSTQAPTTLALPTGQDPVHADANRPKKPYDQILAAMLNDIRQFWTTTYPEVYGKPYEDLQGGIYAAYPGVENVPGCGTSQTTYEDIKGNAFYCSQGDFFAFDDTTLFPQIYSSFGPYPLGMVVAHEWGHAIQARAGVTDQPSIVLEQQADCFAGAWMAHVAANQSPYLRLTDTDLRAAIAGMLTFRDQPGITANQQEAHGSGFDRVGAFQDGFTSGAEKCTTYPTNPPTVIELPFNPSEVQTHGNEPFSQILTDVPAALDSYWSGVFASKGEPYKPLAGTLTPFASGGPYPTCGGQPVAANSVTYCAADGKIYYDTDFLSGPVYSIGDFAVGLLLANAWSQGVQAQRGVTTSGAERSLQADCLTGTWAGNLVPSNAAQQKFSLSAGDLDEGLTAFLRYGTGAADQVGTLFQQTEAFRKGLLGGISACGAA